MGLNAMVIWAFHDFSGLLFYQDGIIARHTSLMPLNIYCTYIHLNILSGVQGSTVSYLNEAQC